ncbi:MAG: FAD-dependent oxidoreductase [Gammaproteobacteria bacterium]|nr:FAD-dependent oxidoreductase [Gammaproteobacteria bacterium]
MIPEPAHQFINKSQPEAICVNEKILSIEIENNQIRAVHTRNKRISCQQLVLATSLTATRQLLKPLQSIPAVNQLINKISKINFQPIVTVYLVYETACKLPELMSGILGGLSHWVFDHRLTGQENMLAVVISGEGKHQEISREELIEKIDNELRSIFTLPKLIHGLVNLEKKATFDCVPGINDFRPQQKTEIEGLYLAGDYTQTGYPSTLEGAIISGKKSAQIIKSLYPLCQ